VIVLDTHALLLWLGSPDRLGRLAARAIASVDVLGIPSIVFWEAALLARRGRVDLGLGSEAWMRLVLSLPRAEPLPLTPQIAVAADGLAMHADPADRFIVATAIHHDAAVVTRDRLIRDTGLVTTIW
jgi:PIN domain nuclease of toxin-antitoxin system